jgi:hypothetical protein
MTVKFCDGGLGSRFDYRLGRPCINFERPRSRLLLLLRRRDYRSAFGFNDTFHALTDGWKSLLVRLLCLGEAFEPQLDAVEACW